MQLQSKRNLLLHLIEFVWHCPVYDAVIHWKKLRSVLLVVVVVVVVVVVTLFIHGKFISSVNYKILMIINTILKTKTILIYTNKTLLYMNAVCYKR